VVKIGKLVELASIMSSDLKRNAFGGRTKETFTDAPVFSASCVSLPEKVCTCIKI
jgi:hypothetical protein